MAQPEFNGRQNLRITHNADGTAGGVLKCSIVLALSEGPALECTDVVADVAVGCVLNPINGVFLADEIQRLMRIGLGAWLVSELTESALIQVTATPNAQTLHFAFLDLSGNTITLAVDIDPDTSKESLVPLARAKVRQWAKSLPRHAPAEWITGELALADLTNAPLLQCGLARLSLPATA